MDLPPLMVLFVASWLAGVVDGQSPQGLQQQKRRNRVMSTAVSCDQQSIYFRINFERAFRGLIYTERGYPNCVYVNGTSQSQISYDVRVPLRGCLTRRLPNGDFENAVVVQDDPNYLEASDRKFLLTCVPTAAGANRDSSFTVSFGGVTVQSALSSTEVIRGSGGASQLDYKVEVRKGLGPTGPLVSGPLTVGDEISYVVRVEDMGGQDARLGRCWANDGVSSIELADQRGCSVQPAGNVWGGFRRVATGAGGRGRVYYNSIKAWAFPTSNRVNIFCNLHVCADRCPIYACADAASANKRTKRARSAANRQQQLDHGAAEEVETVVGAFQVFPSKRQTKVLRAPGPPSLIIAPLAKEQTVVDLSHNSIVNSDFLDERSVTAAKETEAEAGERMFCLRRVHLALLTSLLAVVVVLCLILLAVWALRACRSRRTVPWRRRRPAKSFAPASDDVSSVSTVGSLRRR